MRLPWRRRRPAGDLPAYPERSFLRHPGVPPLEEWLPSGIAGRIRVPGREHEWVMVRRSDDTFFGEHPYQLFLSEPELRYGDGEWDWMYGTAAGSMDPGPEGGPIDVLTMVLDVEWDTSPEAWEEARAFFVAQSMAERAAETRAERMRRERWQPSYEHGYVNVGPFEGPM